MIAIIIGFFMALISFFKKCSECIQLTSAIIEEITNVGNYVSNFKDGARIAMERTGLSRLIAATSHIRSRWQRREDDANDPDLRSDETL